MPQRVETAVFFSSELQVFANLDLQCSVLSVLVDEMIQ